MLFYIFFISIDIILKYLNGYWNYVMSWDRITNISGIREKIFHIYGNKSGVFFSLVDYR